MRRSVIVGTAGHIDHGKTALVEALTGVNTDRWEEERRRGITIDLGFAHLDLGEEMRLGFVDVPGHERFVRNMLAGATGIDVVLLVVAADESIMPQTREHFDICRLLGVRAGVVALTKSDAADEETLELVRLETSEFVEGSFLAEAPMVAVSARTGAGLGELRAALADAARSAPARPGGGRFRLPVDRAFSMKGFGTVVTGTLVSGAVAVEDEVEIHPLGRRARVRGVQSHGERVERIGAGSRVAINLAGIEVADLARGMSLAEPGTFEPSAELDCEIEMLPGAPALKHGAPVHLHVGAAEVEAKVLLLERTGDEARRVRSLAPGGKGLARLRLADPALAVSGDRFVIRRFSPVTTVGGGRVLDPLPPARRENYAGRLRRLRAWASADLGEILDWAASASRFGLPGEAIVRRTGATDAPLAAAAKKLAAAGRLAIARERPLYVIHSDVLTAARERLLADLEAHHRANPLAGGKPRGAVASGLFAGAPDVFVGFLLDGLLAEGRVAADGELLRLASFSVRLAEDEARARETTMAAFREAGLAAPGLAAFLAQLPLDRRRSRKIVGALLREGALVEIAPDFAVHSEALEGLLKRLAERKPAHPRLTVPEFKELSGVSRKYAIPLLEYLDKRRVTRREGDARILL